LLSGSMARSCFLLRPELRKGVTLKLVDVSLVRIGELQVYACIVPANLAEVCTQRGMLEGLSPAKARPSEPARLTTGIRGPSNPLVSVPSAARDLSPTQRNSSLTVRSTPVRTEGGTHLGSTVALSDVPTDRFSGLSSLQAPQNSGGAVTTPHRSSPSTSLRTFDLEGATTDATTGCPETVGIARSAIIGRASPRRPALPIHNAHDANPRKGEIALFFVRCLIVSLFLRGFFCLAAWPIIVPTSQHTVMADLQIQNFLPAQRYRPIAARFHQQDKGRSVEPLSNLLPAHVIDRG
jgi:hypothetical protein